MGRRERQRRRSRAAGPEPRAPTSDYADAEGNVLTLRGALTPATRREYAAARSGPTPAASREDAWQRSVELLFERLAVRWVIAGLAIERQDELLGRFRLASTEERTWIREALREHLAEHFPDLEAP